jgi:hypothetical protein
VAFFRRRAAGSADAVASFWGWWQAEGRDAAERSIDGRLPAGELARLMAEQVQAVGPLGWELGAGETSRHVLVLTAEGNPDVRGLARRLVLAAPDPDDTWSYLDARPPAPDPDDVVLSGGDGEVRMRDVVVGARKDGSRLDVTLHHPVFPDISEEARAQVTFLALDAALGEVDTELWIGDVTPSEVAPLDGFGLPALRALVADLKRGSVDADGNPSWVLLHGETPSGVLLAAARTPLHPITAPHLDTHVAVVLPYEHATEDGLPADGSLEPLRDLEDRLGSALGTSGTIVAHQSTAGVRTLHVYVDSTARVEPTVRQVAGSWPQGRASVHAMKDPGWHAVEHLRT